jgi:DNA-binding XRE family transcriptional regulator
MTNQEQPNRPKVVNDPETLEFLELLSTPLEPISEEEENEILDKVWLEIGAEKAANPEEYARRKAAELYNLPITGASKRLQVPLKRLRIKAGLSRIALAEKSAIPLHIIEMWEEGKYYYSERLLTKLAPALEVQADTLIKLATGALKSLEEIEG